MQYLRKIFGVCLLAVCVMVCGQTVYADNEDSFDAAECVFILDDDSENGVFYLGEANPQISVIVPDMEEYELSVESSNPLVAKVSEPIQDAQANYYFTLTLCKTGSTTVTVKDSISGASVSKTYQVVKPIISFGEELSFSVKAGKKILLSPWFVNEQGSMLYNVSDRFTFTSSKPGIATVSSKGKVTGKKAGITSITITGKKTGAKKKVKVYVYGRYNMVYNGIKQGSIDAIPSQLKLSKGTISYTNYAGSYSKKYAKDAVLQLKNYYSISNSMYLKFTDSGKCVDSLYLTSDGKLYIYFSRSVSVGKTHKGTVTFKIGSKKLKFKYRYNLVGFTDTTYKFTMGDKKNLKLRGYSGKVKYTSSNTSVATISSRGVLTAKAPGAVVITARISGRKFACVVNVARNKNVWALLDEQAYILSNWSYSQEPSKRNADGYYDCSSLVYRTFKKYEGINFGNNYSAWSGSEADWCDANVSQIAYRYGNLNLQPADLGICFTSDWRNGSTWHATTFGYYQFIGYNEKGKACIGEVWYNGSGGYEYFKVFRPLEKAN